MKAPPNKTIIVDEKEFDRYEKHLMREVVRRIRKNLRDIGVPAPQLRDATLTLAFSFASIIDDCAGMMQPDGNPLIPVLAFDTGTRKGSKLIGRELGTYMHEYIGDIVDEEFQAP
jgi:hypothetical protein